MAGSNTGTITFAKLRLEGSAVPPANGVEALRSSIVAGTFYERYGRHWRMARFKFGPRFVTGRIGYETVGSVEELWNEEAKDFQESVAKLGATSPFSIDLSTFRIGFQLRSSKIKTQSFVGAFQALLNEAATGRFRWEVEPELVGLPWEDWRERVDRVNSLRIRMDRPNPHFKGRDRVKSLIEGTRAQMATMLLQASDSSPEGVNVDDAFVIEAVDHAREYGRVTAEGRAVVDEVSLPTKWDSDVDGATQRRRVPTDPRTKEVSPMTLEREVARGEDALPDEQDTEME